MALSPLPARTRAFRRSESFPSPPGRFTRARALAYGRGLARPARQVPRSGRPALPQSQFQRLSGPFGASPRAAGGGGGGAFLGDRRGRVAPFGRRPAHPSRIGSGGGGPARP